MEHHNNHSYSKLYKINFQDNSKTVLLTEFVNKAESFISRGIGLLGKKVLGPNHVLLIRPCNNIHTFFMKFAIDVIFVDKNFVIIKTFSNVKPFKLLGPYWKSTSVIEAESGFVNKNNLQIGDHLYVVD